MSISVTLPDGLAADLVAEAAKRGVTPDELATELIAAALLSHRPNSGGHRLRFGAIGASTGGHRAREDERMLGDGFGH